MVQAAGVNPLAAGDGTARGFAGDDALVERRDAGGHDAIGWQNFARTRQHAIAAPQRRRRDHRLAAVRAEAAGERRAQRGEIGGDAPRLAAHGGVKIAPEQEKGEQHDRAVEISARRMR